MMNATVSGSVVSAAAAPLTLRRELGKWDLTAIGINQVIGSAVFILPSQVAAQVGNWSPIAFLGIGFASLLVALCFAEVGSRFEGTGGPYLYTRAAFGRFVAFEVGWMQWFTRVTGQASVVNAIALALSFYWPVMASGVGRALMIAAVTLAVGWINLRGIRQSAFVIQSAHHRQARAARAVHRRWFVVHRRQPPHALGRSVADPIVHGGAPADLRLRRLRRYRRSGLVASPAARACRSPSSRRSSGSRPIMALAQIVAIGTLADLPASKTPLADASLLFIGAAGALIISADLSSR